MAVGAEAATVVAAPNAEGKCQVCAETTQGSQPYAPMFGFALEEGSIFSCVILHTEIIIIIPPAAAAAAARLSSLLLLLRVYVVGLLYMWDNKRTRLLRLILV